MIRRIHIASVIFVFSLTLFGPACIEQPDIADDQLEVVVEPEPAQDVLVKFNCNSDCECPTLKGCTPQHKLCHQTDAGVCERQQNGCESWCPVEAAVSVPADETP